MASTTNHIMFEALFDLRLKPAGPFAEELKAAGYSPATAVPKYPTEVWIKCLQVAHRHAWPGLTWEAALRNAGREFAEGFLKTFGGRVAGAALPFMTPRLFVRRLLGYIRMSRNDPGLTIDFERDEPGAIDVLLHNPSGVPGNFLAGIVDAGLSRFHVIWKVEVVAVSPTDSRLLMTWKKQ